MKALCNGKICTKDGFCNSLVIDGKYIKAIGDKSDLNDLIMSSETVIDLKGKTVIPGMIDSHAHGAHSFSLSSGLIDLTDCNNLDEYIDVIRNYVSENPDKEVYRGIGWSATAFDEHGPCKEILDEIIIDRPMALKAVEGHSLWVNSKAIEMTGITPDTPDPQAGVIMHNPDGSIRGVFKEEAQELIESRIPDMSVEHYEQAILDYQSFMVRYGVTGACELDMRRGSNMHKAYRRLAEDNKLLIKACMHYKVSSGESCEEIEKEFSGSEKMYDNKLVDGYFAKIFVDGVVEGETAWLLEPYEHGPDKYGNPLWSDEQLYNACKQLDKLGYDIHFHCIGDAATAQVVRVIEALTDEKSVSGDRRFVIAHIQLARDEDIKKLGELGIMVSANPYWFGREPGYYYQIERPFLGDRAERQYPMRRLLDAGVLVSAGSDFSVTPEPNPIMAVKVGMERSFRDIFPGCDEVLWDEERVGFMDMFNAITINAAITSRMETKTGNIEVGKYADLAVLNKDIFSTPPSEMQNISINMTVSEGEIVYSDSMKDSMDIMEKAK